MSKINIMKKSIIEIINNNDVSEFYIEEVDGKIIIRLELKTVTAPCMPTTSHVYPSYIREENE